jgi:hypothetical protein
VTQREVCRLADFESEDADACQLSADDASQPVQSDTVAEAHRQRERLQSQVMEGLMQLQPAVEIQQPCITDELTSLESPWQIDESRQSVYRVRQDNWPRKSSVSSGITTHRSVAYRTLTLEKSEIDKANKDKQHKLFPADFKVSNYLKNKSFTLLQLHNRLPLTALM